MWYVMARWEVTGISLRSLLSKTLSQDKALSFVHCAEQGSNFILLSVEIHFSKHQNLLGRLFFPLGMLKVIGCCTSGVRIEIPGKKPWSTTSKKVYLSIPTVPLVPEHLGHWEESALCLLLTRRCTGDIYPIHLYDKHATLMKSYHNIWKLHLTLEIWIVWFLKIALGFVNSLWFMFDWCHEELLALFVTLAVKSNEDIVSPPHIGWTSLASGLDQISP